MNVHQLSSLQSWLERIHHYLSQGEILKARFASLLLPIFEAWELPSVLKKICFRSSRLPSESISPLISKASLLAFHMIFAAPLGFKYPHYNYELHQRHGFTYEEKKEGILSPASVEKEQTPNSNESNFKEKVKTIKRAPHITEKRKSCQFVRNENHSSDRMPESLAKIFQHSPQNASSPSSIPNQLKAIEVLTQKLMSNKGSWKVKDGQIQFNPSKILYIEPPVINLLFQTYQKGFFTQLPSDQAYNLQYNLKQIANSLNTFKGPYDFDQLSEMTHAIQQLTAQ